MCSVVLVNRAAIQALAIGFSRCWVRLLRRPEVDNSNLHRYDDAVPLTTTRTCVVKMPAWVPPSNITSIGSVPCAGRCQIAGDVVEVIILDRGLRGPAGSRVSAICIGARDPMASAHVVSSPASCAAYACGV